jgi:hypothetical protein
VQRCGRSRLCSQEGRQARRQLCVALNKLSVCEQNMLLRVKERKEADNLAVFTHHSGLVLRWCISPSSKRTVVLIDNFFDLHKLGRARIHIQNGPDDLTLLCVFFFICGRESGFDSLETFCSSSSAVCRAPPRALPKPSSLL